MTAQQAIERANEMKQGNVAPDNVKLSWLTELDQIIYDEVIKRHVQEPPKDLFGYSEYLFYVSSFCGTPRELVERSRGAS